MVISKRLLWKRPIVWLSLLGILYIVMRCTNLLSLPIFTDEAIYIRWAQIGGNDASWRFISLTDGKQPFFTWLVMATLRLFDDPLFAGRIVSVVAGFVSFIGLYFLGVEVFSKRSIGLIASFLYVISPFALMYDRMALYDSWVATFSIWNLYVAILLVRHVRLDIALIFGLTLGVGMLNKTSAFLSLYLVPATLVLFDWKNKKRIKQLIAWMVYVLVAAILSQAVYSILRLSPYFYIISQKDALFVYPLSEWITHPFRFLQGNLHGEFDWLIHYLTIPVFICVFLPFLLFWKKSMEKILLFVWWFAPFVALALFGKVLYPRFIFFMTMPLLVLVSYTFDWILGFFRHKIFGYIIILLILIQSIGISYSIISNIKSAKIPSSDVGQYISDWPSGWGINEVVVFLKKESEDHPIAVYTEGTFGLFPFALEIYLGTNKNIEIHGLWPLSKALPMEIEQSARQKDTYFITNLTQTITGWPLEFIASYQKGNNSNVSMHVYKVELPKE